MGKFTNRLVRAQEATEMTTSDLMRWFGRPRATVNTWLNGRTPFGPQRPLAEERLALLEWSIKTRKAKCYPIPAHLTWKDRETYVRGMFDDAQCHAGLSAMRAAG